MRLRPLAHPLADERPHVARGAHVDAERGLVEEQHLGIGQKPRAKFMRWRWPVESRLTAC